MARSYLGAGGGVGTALLEVRADDVNCKLHGDALVFDALDAL